ncbi:molybdate ABC transporter substrate-binding protein [Stenoxybacter acetivorans]|uniref:molybdate ABC transporter substrate-binding protein n=1 Tax=Stenoxybacter acetivorans TaxID=422441 RepID=UPI0005676B2E|nr:molybdate ABC transporter substrate-binding protein [Stenoxybacter acetivorans]
MNNSTTRSLGKRLLLSIFLCLFSGSLLAADIVVSAAASLTNAFKDIAKAYEQQYPQDTVHLNFGGSGILLRQIENGAPADVFASADTLTMDLAQQKNLIMPQHRQVFAGNELVLIVPKNSNVVLRQLSDLQQQAIGRIAIANPDTAPAGHYAQLVLTQAGLWQALQPKFIKAQDVRQALNYVARDETDAGLVFATDAKQMQNTVKTSLNLPVPTAIVYPIAAVNHNQPPKDAALRFIRFVLSAPAQNILTQYGFKPLHGK